MSPVPGRRNLATRDRPDEVPNKPELDMWQDREVPIPYVVDVAASEHQQGSKELMLTMLMLVAAGTGGIILILLVVIVVAIRQEPRDIEMTDVAPSRVAIRVRRLLGVYLRRPAPQYDGLDEPEERPSGAWPTAPWTNSSPLPPGRRR
jgi:hypothetical protein